ncbi:hypothetical protein [Paractinoplanes hotanensis]|uniref:Orc1-like AAA ATPase domain-containing protein n=1 Tax=Paractinoplanes hotanensis TaxID=2906497 RepID=A0ABT0XZ95_9ACTN|nr:hypothetical protein [Actinoplanes hotanensis]MCM4079116.1 hypothetical protein [Actinoplanes hotanensis]
MDVDLRVRPELLKELRRHARGLVFAVGERGSGRSATLAAFAGELRQDDEPPIVACYRFSNDPAELLNRALLAQLVAAVAESPHAERQLCALGESRRLDEPGDLLAMLRIAARVRPVVCLLDDFSAADLVWWRLFLRDSAPELARLPLLIVAALDAGEGRIVDHQDLATSLDSWFASTVRLGPAGADELEAQIGGRLVEPLRSDVFELAGGGAGRVGDLWRELVDGGAVEFDRDEWRWRWGEPEDHSGFVRDAFDRRIRQRCPTPEECALAWAVVRMAAIEGPEFTPAAVAVALHRIGCDGCDDVDAVVDFIDEVLAGPELFEVGDTAWRWRDRYAYRARFLHLGHAEALRRFGLDDEERRDWAAALGYALEELYVGAADHIGPVLAGVWAQAGEPDRAGCAGALTERRRRGLMRDEAAEPVDHLIYVDHLLTEARGAAPSNPWRALELGRRALSEAERSGSGNAVALSLVTIAAGLQALDKAGEALPYASRAAAVAGAHPSTRRRALTSLASCRLAIAEDGDLAEAERISDELLATATSATERRTAHALREQARAAELFGTGALPEARAVLLAAPDPSCLRLLRTIADRLGDTAVAEELAHLSLVLAWDDARRRAWAGQDAEVARLAAALDDLGGYLRKLHAQA